MSSTTRADRVANALQSLLERLVPRQLPGESEASADRRWEEANDFATRIIDEANTTDGGAGGEEVNHAADLISKRLVKSGKGSPEKAAAFGGLYSRLLAQPVLGRKWGILWFLLRVGEEEMEEDGEEGDSGEGEEEEVFDEAFGRNGVGKFPAPARGPESPRREEDGGLRERMNAARERRQEQEQERQREEEREREAEAASSPVKGTVGGLEPSEPALLRDLPFTLQGLSSNHLPFADKRSVKLPATLPVPLVSLLHSLAEPSLLYRSLSDFVESEEGGLVGQALRSAIGVELRSYLGLVATLEGQIRRALAQLDESLPHGGLGKAAVTLKRCVVWTREATLGLRLMSMMVESAKGKKGGELISLIHTFSSSHGDPFVHTFAERLLSHVTRPFYNMLRAWIYDGELEDPYHEFFVYENQDNDDTGATSVWEHKYRLKEGMIPSIVTADFAQRVFLIGKSLNFIRYGCGDSNWVESYSKSASRELKYGDTAMLSSSIDEAYKTVMARLLHLLENKFALTTNLRALKKYLLLGQGDFIALLMESLASALDRPANSQYRHTLTAQLEHAINHSNAQHDGQEVLRRLDARMLELSHGEIGWDVFTLEYRVDPPLDVIVTPWANRQYLKVFNFLWRVKRVEFALSTTWRRLQTGARGVLSAVTHQLGADWKTARGALAEMIHFIDQLQYYILFEVIEKGWTALESAIHKPDATLDTLIEAHTKYLRDITRKGLLGGAGHYDFSTQLHEILKLMLLYKDAVDSLYSYSVAEFTRRQEMATRIESRTRAGRWGITEADEDVPPSTSTTQSPLFPPSSTRGGTRNEPASPLPGLLHFASGADNERQMLDNLRQRLKALPTDFRARINLLLGDLGHQPDGDMRFLAVVMNFNERYVPVRRGRLNRDKGKEGERQAQEMGKGREKERGGGGGESGSVRRGG